MKAQSKEKKIKTEVSLKKETPYIKQNMSFLGKKIKAPLTQERKNKYKSSVKLNRSNLSEKKISKEKNQNLNKSTTSAKPLNKSLSLNSNRSNSNNKILSKPPFNLSRINNSTNKNKNLNLNKEKLTLSNLQSGKPINRNNLKNFKANPKQIKKQNALAEKKITDNYMENALTPVKDRRFNLEKASASAGKKTQRTYKSNSSKKKKNKTSEKNNFSPEADVEANINQFDSAAGDFNYNYNLNLNTFSDLKEYSSKKPTRVSFLESASKFKHNSAEKYIFKSSGKKSISKTPQKKDNYSSAERNSNNNINNSSKKKKGLGAISDFNNHIDFENNDNNDNDDNFDNFLRSEPPKKHELNESLSGKKSKTKSFISNLSKEKTLTKSDKKSIKSIKNSVKKINFYDEALEKDQNKANSLTFSSGKKKRNIK
jgi:hypothetical protein